MPPKGWVGGWNEVGGDRGKRRQEFIRQAHSGWIKNNNPFSQHLPGNGQGYQQGKNDQATQGEPILLKDTPGFLNRGFRFRQRRLPFKRYAMSNMSQFSHGYCKPNAWIDNGIEYV